VPAFVSGDSALFNVEVAITNGISPWCDDGPSENTGKHQDLGFAPEGGQKHMNACLWFFVRVACDENALVIKVSRIAINI
jgi:hypothetical protein